jgi:hypothetical protein
LEGKYSEAGLSPNMTPRPFLAAPILREGAIRGVNPNSSGPSWFWHVATTKANVVEEAIVLVAYIDDLAGTVTVDSQWMSDDYKASPGQSIVAFQIWAELALG